MANDRNRDELDRDRAVPPTEDVRGHAGPDEADPLADDEQYDSDEEVTGEVGSEGGSPGETVTTRRPAGNTRGSEAGEISPPEDRGKTVERVGDEDQPLKRNP